MNLALPIPRINVRHVALAVVLALFASFATAMSVDQIVPEPVVAGESTVGRIGVIETASQGMMDKARVTVQEAPLAALGGAVSRTWDMSVLTLRMLGKLVVGQASLDNISGPISIAQYAGQSASVGPAHYINFIALISISLAVLNLLPIPMLDGGHLLYFALEAVRGKPVSERVQIIGQQVFGACYVNRQLAPQCPVLVHSLDQFFEIFGLHRCGHTRRNACDDVIFCLARRFERCGGWCVPALGKC